MSAVSDIRAALRTRLEAMDGVRVADEIPGAAMITGQACGAVISYTGTTYMLDGDGNASRTFTVTVLAGLVSDRSAIAKLDAFCDTSGPGSIYDALDGPIAGGVAHDVRVISDSGHSTYTVGSGAEAADYLGCEFNIDVMV
jgi:hypothetical protein